MKNEEQQQGDFFVGFVALVWIRVGWELRAGPAEAGTPCPSQLPPFAPVEI
jgi:hypothetical protein